MTRALVLGGYGLIGAAVMRALTAAGCEVTGAGRTADLAHLSGPNTNWILRDLVSLDARDWAEIVEDFDVVINAAGVLQDGGQDNLTAIHVDMVAALTEGLGGRDTRLIQISAAGAASEAATSFLRTKARGDELIIMSGLDYVIFRPTLVIGKAAYGGSALLRAAAAVPLISLRMFPDSQIQTVALQDVVEPVVLAVKGKVPSGTVADLTEPRAHSFPDLIADIRRWHGFGEPKFTFDVPNWILSCLARTGDFLGRFGWRAPLRSTSLTTLEVGVIGSPHVWDQISSTACRDLRDTLASLPTSVQDRWFARLYLLFPLLVVTLGLFWALSGLIGFWSVDAATAILSSRGVAPASAECAVIVGAIIDLTLGIGVIWRRRLGWVCLGMVAVSLGYLMVGTVLAPDLWLDPMGPFVKIFPGLMLALIVAALSDNR